LRCVSENGIFTAQLADCLRYLRVPSVLGVREASKHVCVNQHSQLLIPINGFRIEGAIRNLAELSSKLLKTTNDIVKQWIGAQFGADFSFRKPQQKGLEGHTGQVRLAPKHGFQGRTDFKRNAHDQNPKDSGRP